MNHNLNDCQVEREDHERTYISQNWKKLKKIEKECWHVCYLQQQRHSMPHISKAIFEWMSAMIKLLQLAKDSPITRLLVRAKAHKKVENLKRWKWFSEINEVNRWFWDTIWFRVAQGEINNRKFHRSMEESKIKRKYLIKKYSSRCWLGNCVLDPSVYAVWACFLINFLMSKDKP